MATISKPMNTRRAHSMRRSRPKAHTMVASDSAMAARNTQVAWRSSSPVSQGRLAWSPASAGHDDWVAFWMTAHTHANAARSMKAQAMKVTKRDRDPTL